VRAEAGHGAAPWESSFSNGASLPRFDLAATSLMLLAGCSERSSERVEAATEAFARRSGASCPGRSVSTITSGCRQAPCTWPARIPARSLVRTSWLCCAGWKLIWKRQGSALLEHAVADFQDYLDKSMGVRVEVEGRDSLKNWQSLGPAIVVGTREQLPGCGTALQGPKDYEIAVTPERVTVCGTTTAGRCTGSTTSRGG